MSQQFLRSGVVCSSDMSGHAIKHKPARGNRLLNRAAVLAIGLFLWNPGARAQVAAQQHAGSAPVLITLDEAIKRAQANEPSFAAARAASQSAALDRSISRAGLLPTARLYSQDIYTQPNGIYTEGDAGQPSAPLPRFVANDSRPWEYMAQGIAEESVSVAGLAAVRRADAAAVMAQAEMEIARRGLVATVTALYFGSLAADHKAGIAQRAYQDAKNFTTITQDREKQGEAAHADVLKARLTEQEQWRQLQEAALAAQTARLDLGVLLFPDPRTPYSLQEPQALPPLASFADVEAAAARFSPEMKSVLANLNASNADVLGARAALMPSLGLNVTYGIDANQFSVNGPLVAGNGLPGGNSTGGVKARNLGYSSSVTVNLPVWDWLSTEHKVKQSEIRRDAARVALTNTQRQMIAELQADYVAAQTARNELDSLDSSVADAAESLRLSELRYKSGEALVLEVVDAQSAYVTAENAREDGYVHYRNALAALQTLTGSM
jgi:outer membrane protein TolC